MYTENKPMRQTAVSLCALLILCLVTVSCETVPVTGREQLNLISSEQLHSMAVGSYSEFLAGNQVVTGTESARMVKSVGRDIQDALSQQPAMTQQLFMAAFGVGAQVGVLLPYSRLQESEADRTALTRA